MDSPEIAGAIARCDAWLDTMRGPQGYGGPVAHWWKSCLLYAGVGLDWRYEGIILGYLKLHARTGDGRWLAKARRAGDDLLNGQLPNGSYRNSCFELNPYPGGTPHEAACDLALLELARVLRQRGDAGWEGYGGAAEHNLRGYYLGRLWDREAQRFWDDPELRSFVPNKAATLAEAWLKLAELTGHDEPAVAYGLPALRAILDYQVRGGRLDGAIDQSGRREKRAGRYFPYYIARCVAGLLAGHDWARDDRYLDAALRAMGFVLRTRYDDGSFPQVVYAGGHVNRYPQWVAGVGDILRAMEVLRPFGVAADPQPTLDWLLRGQGPAGGFRTARGFASQVSQREPGPLPEFRDLLAVAGWTDKAFRYLAGTVDDRAGSKEQGVHEEDCVFRGKRYGYREDRDVVQVHLGGQARYRWRKGQAWAEMAAPESWGT